MGDETVSYANLSRRVQEFIARARQDIPETLARPLILLETSNALASCVAYIAALQAGWPVILVGEGTVLNFPDLVARYSPNIVIYGVYEEPMIDVLHTDQVALHPDLAVLLSTSGSTGSAKIVRLSVQNLQANAEAIASYLELTAADRAMTALPLHYSYGMSILNSYLLVGASLVLSRASVAEPEFWSNAKAKRITSLGLVPTQYEILDKAGFTKQWCPTLRYMTQAGGRLDAALALKFAKQAKVENWLFFIMYGQTEASPRMSFVPPQDAEKEFDCIGLPIPGGRFSLLDTQGQLISGTGKSGVLVYEGPNVMMGYALSPADFALSAGPPRLVTGDIAERLENGYFRISGRANRFIKLFGLRIGLDEVEISLGQQGDKVFASGSDRGLVLFMQGKGRDSVALRRKAARLFKLPETVVKVCELRTIPLMDSGKVDYRQLSQQAETLLQEPKVSLKSLEAILQRALRTQTLDLDRSFLEMGGDSLSYLEVQIYLSDAHGSLPDRWESLPLGSLLMLDTASVVANRPGLSVSVELIVRVMALLSVMALHSTDWPVPGGAYMLLILSGSSLARFQSAALFKGRVLKTLRIMLLPILTCYLFLMTAFSVVGKRVDLEWFLLLGNFDSKVPFPGLVPYWFVCTYAQIMVIAVFPFAFPTLRDNVRRWPLESGLLALLAVVGCNSMFGFDAAEISVRHHNPLAALELLLVGWCCFFARDQRQRLIVGAAFLGMFMLHWRDASPSIAVLMFAGTGGMLWALKIQLHHLIARLLMMVGSLALFVYLVHPVVISIVLKILYSSDIVRFSLVAGLSLLCAYVFKLAFDAAFTLVLKTGQSRQTQNSVGSG